MELDMTMNSSHRESSTKLEDLSWLSESSLLPRLRATSPLLDGVSEGEVDTLLNW
jgi:hypothetical protein